MWHSQRVHGDKSEYYVIVWSDQNNQSGFFGKVKCALDVHYFEILDDADPWRMEVLKPKPVYRYGRIILSGDIMAELLV